MTGCLIHLTPLDTSTGLRTDVRVSTFGKRSEADANGKGGEEWVPCVAQAPSIGIELWNGDFTASVKPGGAVIAINLETAKDQFPGLERYNWAGATCTIYVGEASDAWPWAERFVGKVRDYSGVYPRLSLRCEVDTEPFDAEVLTATYAGTGDEEGGADLKNVPKPLIIGRAKNVEPRLINVTDSIYQFSAYGPIEEVTALYERGSDFGAADADYADYATLLAATINPGKWATCLAEGMIRLGAPQAGVITGDVLGHEVSGSTPRLTGAVIQAIATIASVSGSLIDTTSLGDLDTDKPYNVNIAIFDQTTFIDVARRMTLACNWQSGISLTGTYFATKPDLGATSSLSVDALGATSPQVITSEELSVSPPYAKTIMGADRSWRVHTGDEIAFTAELVERGLYDAGETYREGNIVTLADGSRWLYINPVPTSGNAPPTWPTTSNTWWENLNPPLDIIGAEQVDAYLGVDTLYVTVNKDGVVSSYSGLSTTFIAKLPDGTDVSTNFALSTDTGGNPDGLTVGYASQTVTISGGIASSGEDVTTLTILATGSGDYSGYFFRRKLFVVKSYNGALSTFVANANDRNVLTPSTPGTISSIGLERTYDSGNVSIKGTFSFTYNADPEASNNIDGFEIGYWVGDTSSSHTMGTDEREVLRYVISDLSNSSHTVIFASDVAPNKYYTLGVRAVRKVHPDVSSTGFIKSAWRQSSPYRPAATHDFNGTVGGVASSVLADAAANFNADNDGNGLTPDSATSVALSSIQYPDSTAAITVTWNHTPSATPSNKNSIDGYLVGLRLSSSGAGYTYSPSDDHFMRWQAVRSNFDQAKFNGMPVDQYYTAVVIPYRLVRTDIDTDGLVLANPAQSSSTTPHRPATSPNFTGTIQGVYASIVAPGGYAAYLGVNSDGTIKNDKVLTDAIAADAINKSLWIQQGGTLTVSAGGTGSATLLGSTMNIQGARAVVDLIMQWRARITNPVQGTEYYMQFRIWADTSTGIDRYTDYWTESVKWELPSAAGVYYSETRVSHRQGVFDSSGGNALSVGHNYNFGYIVSLSGIANSIELVPYRFCKAHDLRAIE